MKTKTSTLLFCMCLAACHSSEKLVEGDQIAYEKDGRIRVDEKSAFYKKLSVVTVSQNSEHDEPLRSVGQMIALGEQPVSLQSAKPAEWLELETSFSRALGVAPALLAKAEIGAAIGVSWIPRDMSAQVTAGETINVYRYGLKTAAAAATVLPLKAKDDSNSDRVLIAFIMRQASTWYPGTTCYVEFPLIKTKPFRISMTSILHEGLGEYVFRQMSDGGFEPVSVTVIHETNGMADVVSVLKNGDSIVEGGAILLKPFLTHFAKDQSGAHHAL